MSRTGPLLHLISLPSRWLWPLLAIPLSLWGCGESPAVPEQDLTAQVDSIIQATGQEISIYYEDLVGGETLLVHPDLRMHAASTMKVPVLIQLFLDRDAGVFSLDDSVEVFTTFRSIVDGSPYSLTAESDSDSTLYALEGEEVSYAHLMELMITFSSNLATNILMEKADPERVTASMRVLGADSIQILRGVEDGPAFRAGLSNTTTARDLGIIMAALGRGEVGNPETSAEMVEILSRQHWRTGIPALLPAGTRVANKTGSITGIRHDSGIVYPQGAPPYALVILTRGFQDSQEADAVTARLSKVIYDHHTRPARQ